MSKIEVAENALFLKSFDNPVFSIDSKLKLHPISKGAIDFVQTLGLEKFTFDYEKFISEYSLKGFRKGLQKAIEGKSNRNFNILIHTPKTADEIHFECAFHAAIENEKGFVVFRNINEEIDAINLLQQSELKHRMLFTKANDAIIIIKNLEIIDCNEKTLSMFESPGFSDISGKKLYQFMPEKQPDGTDSILKYHYLIQEAVSGNSQFFQWRHSKLSGEQFETEVSLNAFTLDDEVFIQVIVRDITKRIEADLKRLQSEKSYFDLFNSSVDYIFLVNQNFEIVEINKKSKEIVGKFSKKKPLGLEVFLDNKSFDALKSTKKKSLKLVGNLKGKNGKIPCDLNYYPSFFNGKEVFVLNARDISEQLSFQKSIKESEENYRLLVNALSDAIIVVKDDKIMFSNPALENFIQKKFKKEIIKFSNLFDAKDYQKILKLSAQKINKPKTLQRTTCTIIGLKKVVEVECISADEKEMKLVIHDISIRKSAEKAKKRADVAEEANERLQKEIHVRIKAEAEVLKAQQYTRSIIDSSIDMIVAVNKEGLVTDFNVAAAEGFGFKGHEFTNINIAELFVLPDQEVYTLKEIINHGSFSGEILFRKADGSHFTAYLSASMLRNDIGESLGTVGVIKDITPLKKAEQRLKENIFQKEILLKEVHHRVKNNMQVIISILKLQSGYIDDEKTILKLQECQDRIKSMAYIHESLYQSDDLSHINFGQYLKNLISNLAHSYRLDTSKIKFEYKIEDISMSIDNSIPCGLIVNELVSNALKYAFPDGKKGKISITLSEKKGIKKLVVKDNGVGIPPKINYLNTDSLGLQLVVTLVQQVNGELEFINKNGAEFIINFKGR
jgi:PAS domain S-box-containing protein